MKIKNSLSLFLLILLGATCSKDKTPVVGILIGVEAYAVVANGFKSKMKKLGFEEGQNITYIIKEAHSNEDEMKRICDMFISQKVDLIFTITHGATVMAKNATEGTNIPVLFAVAVTNKKGELVNSIGLPGGNVTGVRYPVPDMAIKRFEFLLEMKPTIKDLLVPFKENYPPALGVLKGFRSYVKKRGVNLIELSVSSVEELKIKLENLQNVNVDGVHILPEPYAHSIEGWMYIKEFAESKNIPIAGIVPQMYKDGAVFSYNPDEFSMGEMSAPLAKKILTGTPAGSIPVISPNINLRLNYAVAKKLDLKVPEVMLKMAREIHR